jgi:hypothetical protein
MMTMTLIGRREGTGRHLTWRAAPRGARWSFSGPRRTKEEAVRVNALMFAFLLALVPLAILGCAASRGTVADDDATADDDDNDDNDDDSDDDFVWAQMSGKFPALISVWGTSHDDVFAVGPDWTANTAAVFHFDGRSWSQMTSGEGAFGLWAVSGTSQSDVFAVGDGDETVIIHYDGDSWSIMPAPADFGYYLRGVWAGSASNVYAVGCDAKYDGMVGHFDGATWSVVNGDFPLSLQSVWGTSPSDVYVSGGTGTSHFDGATWSPVPGAIGNAIISSFWGISSSDVFAVGVVNMDGVIVHYDGSSWSVVYDEPSAALASGVWGTSPDDVFAVGSYEDRNDAGYDQILHYDGSSWSIMDNGTYPFALLGVWASGPSDVFTVGYDDNEQAGVVLHYGPPQ